MSKRDAAKSLVISMLYVLPRHQVEGRKRLQKLAYLSGCGVQDETVSSYRLHFFGPYSKDVAIATDDLVFSGELTEKLASISNSDSLQFCYELTSNATKPTSKTTKRLQPLLEQLDHFTTVELEVASTVAYHLTRGESYETAVAKTKEMKPNRAVLPVLRKAEAILETIGLR
ncbi:MAG: hypothetical protein WD044_13705 [Dongiaceae bacterium]